MSFQLKAVAHVRAIQDGSGAVLLDLKRGTYFSLNGVGAVLWSRLNDKASVDELVSYASSRYTVPIDNVREHVQGFIAELDGAGLLERCRQ